MPQSLNQKVTNTFIKGLITEAGELTFPADASVDELNCLLERDGSRKRREGIDFEESDVNSTFSVRDSDIVKVDTWSNVAGIPDKELLVVQVNNRLHFYDKGDIPYSGNQLTSFSWVLNSSTTSATSFIPLSNLGYTGEGAINDDKCEFTSISGMLIVAHPSLETTAIIATLDTSRGYSVWSFKVEPITFRSRDFKRLSNRIALSESVAESAVSAERVYDTRNSGWIGEKGAAALSTYVGTTPFEFPALNLSWFAGKDSDGNFSVTEWENIQAGSSVIGQGHNLVNFFNRDRSALGSYRTRAGGTKSLPSSLATEVIKDRFSTVVAMSGRVFYSGLNRGNHEESNVVLFSRIVEGASSTVSIDSTGLGDCHQKNDPTSEDFPDLLDDDGGVIRIPEAYGIRKLHQFNNGVFVFAENGVWQIKGIDDVFRATGFAINKISSIGLFNRETFVSADGIPFWWSDQGIHTLGFNDQTFQAAENNISLTTIQKFFDKINATQKSKCTGVFDPINKRIFWMYPKEDEIVEAKLNNFLILDIALEAFYPWSVSDTSGDSPHILGASYYKGFSSAVLEYNIISNAGDTVVDATLNPVIKYDNGFVSTGEPSLIFLSARSTGAGPANGFSMAYFYKTDFKDWGSANYSSFAEAGYEFMGDLMLRKNAPYVQVYSRVTETGWTGDELSGYQPIKEGSLLVSSFWDFSKTGTQTQQAYRLKPMPVVNSSNLTDFGYPDTVIDTRLKIRGRGKSMRLKFESEEGKDFHLLGYGVLSATNRRF